MVMVIIDNVFIIITGIIIIPNFRAVRDSLLIGLVKKGLQPVIRVTKHLVDTRTDKPTLNIISYEVIDDRREVLGKPAPILLHFFNYLRNLARLPPPVLEAQSQLQVRDGMARYRLLLGIKPGSKLFSFQVSTNFDKN